MYVQNDGFFQKWVGRVLEVDGGNITPRITYASDRAPRVFIEGKTPRCEVTKLNQCVASPSMPR